MPQIKLLLVDDHDVVRTGLKMLLESQPDMILVGEASNGRQALELTSKTVPDVIVMDITLPDISGIEITRQIKENFPDIAIVALTIHDDEEYFFEMLHAGASGYVPKRAAPEDLITAIRAAFREEVYIFPSLAKILVKDFLNQGPVEAQDSEFNQERQFTENSFSRSLDLLTPREQEVMELLAEGLTNQEIGQKLVISKHTVARHREKIMQKLGLHSRGELVKYAIRKGIISP